MVHEKPLPRFEMCAKCALHGSLLLADGVEWYCHSRKTARVCVSQARSQRKISAQEAADLYAAIMKTLLPEDSPEPLILIPNCLSVVGREIKLSELSFVPKNFILLSQVSTARH